MHVLFILTLTFGCEQKAGDSQQPEPSPVQGLPEDAAHNDVTIPDQPVSGKLMGIPFNPEGFDISDAGRLEIWVGDRIFSYAKVSVVLCLGYNESPSGRAYEFHSGEKGRYCPSIILSRKTEYGPPDEKSLQDGYSLKLIFEESREQMISGRIYLSVPDEDTELAGVFHVSEPEDPAQPPEERHRPHVYGRIRFSPSSSGMLAAGYAGIGDDGKIYSNSAGMSIKPGESLGGGAATSTTFKPRNTTMWSDENGILYFRHVHLKPGIYVFAVLWEGKLIFHQWLKVKVNSALSLDPDIDLDIAGTVVVEAPHRLVTEKQDYRQYEPVWLLPLDSYGRIPGGVDEKKIWQISFRLHIEPEDEIDKLIYRFLLPGSYQIRFKDKVETVKVTPGEESAVRFP
ncbi:MAG: hypothetical protein PVG39_32155 [Desulfobacteraceae bacterium]|jgi:hypothetical protein